MEDQIEKAPALELVKGSDTFKLIVSEQLEKKIRFLCKKIWKDEWSGVLFYKVEGDFEDTENPLVIRCIDLYQMDEGTSTFTDFYMSADVAGYVVDHPELAAGGVYQGLIHSHNTMSTFFSGTDTNTLLKEGMDMPHFVSLIVNNAGKYSAAITRHAYSEAVVTETVTYPTWEGDSIEVEQHYKETNEYIKYDTLIIEIEGESREFEEEMEARMEEIRETKKPQTIRSCTWNRPALNDYFPKYSKNVVGEIMETKETEMPTQTIEKPTAQDGDDKLLPYGTVEVDEGIVNAIARQLITGSILITSKSKLDLDKWASSMNSLYEARFEDIEDFKTFATSYVDFIINSVSDKSLFNMGFDLGEVAALVAFEVRELLSKLPKNKWLNFYVELLEDYII
nr:MAG TPA: MPN family protein [Bacteriophage sp.]